MMNTQWNTHTHTSEYTIKDKSMCLWILSEETKINFFYVNSSNSSIEENIKHAYTFIYLE